MSNRVKDPTVNLDSMAELALQDIRSVVAGISLDSAETVCREITLAKKIACYGVGREGLMMKAWCMRLMHLGLDAHFVGDMTTPPLGIGDLLITSAGPGKFSTVLALIGVAKKAGARVLVVTAQPDGEAPKQADTVLYLPAQTMANDTGGNVSILPMGSLYEIVQILVFDLLTIALSDKTAQSALDMRSRHTNLE